MPMLCSFQSGEMGPMVASTLKLGIAILNGGNSTVQQVVHGSVALECQASDGTDNFYKHMKIVRTENIFSRYFQEYDWESKYKKRKYYMH